MIRGCAQLQQQQARGFLHGNLHVDHILVMHGRVVKNNAIVKTDEGSLRVYYTGLD